MMKLNLYSPHWGLLIRRINYLKYFLLISISIFFLTSCQKDKFKWKTRTVNTKEFIIENDSILQLDGVASNKKYGYSPEIPVKLGVAKRTLSLTYPEKYFNSITGPNGEAIRAVRFKSCCPFKTVNSEEFPFQNLGVLEIYKVTYKGLSDPLFIYINFFDQGLVLAPKGFKIKEFDLPK